MVQTGVNNTQVKKFTAWITLNLSLALNFDDANENILGWWLFAVTIVIGSIGVVAGGVVSDRFVAKMGVRSRVIILALSQIIATPFAFGSVYCEPLGAMISLGFSYFFGQLLNISLW